MSGSPWWGLECCRHHSIRDDPGQLCYRNGRPPRYPPGPGSRHHRTTPATRDTPYADNHPRFAVLPSSRDIYTGHRNYELPTPSVPGNAALGRIVAVGTDATKLQPGNLIFVDAVVRGRDDSTAAALSGILGGHSAASKRLIGTEGRDSTYVEYARVPLENSLSWMRSDCWARPSNGGLGYDLNGLLYRGVQLLPFGGLRAVGVGGGDRVIISPATGSFGGAAVQIALAMGASVIAMGRNGEVLKRLRSIFAPRYGEDRIQTV